MFQGLGECNAFDPQPESTEKFGVEEQELNDIHEESEKKTMSGSYHRPFGTSPCQAFKIKLFCAPQTVSLEIHYITQCSWRN